jgi:hypothetical protein
MIECGGRAEKAGSDENDVAWLSLAPSRIDVHVLEYIHFVIICAYLGQSIL